ncbi:MAG: hypothetical protein MUP53_05490 [Bacteroidales bacterium]|nr:hypothetical protein [Bacteroidales bacterium]
MSSIDRVRNWKTTVIGVIVFIISVIMFCIGRVDAYAFIALILLAYTFIMAKNTLLEGITMGIYKVISAKAGPGEVLAGDTDEKTGG